MEEAVNWLYDHSITIKALRVLQAIYIDNLE